MEGIYYEEGMFQNDGSSDDGFDIECFEIGKYYHKYFAEIEEYLVSRSDCHIGHGRDGMTDDIDSHNEHDGEEWRYESRKEQDNGEKEEEFQIDESDGCENHERERSVGDQKHPRRYEGLYGDDEKKNRRKTKEFSEHKIPSSNGFGEDEIDGFSFDLPEEELTSYEDDRNDSEYFHHGESEIHDDFVGLSEGERPKYERETDENDPEKQDHIENFISHEFPESIESDIEHRKKISDYLVNIRPFPKS